MFASSPGSAGSTSGPRLRRATARTFTGPARYLAEQANRTHLAGYLADLARPYGLPVDAEPTGQSYGEMAEALIAETVAEPVDLLMLAFAVPDMQPGRATAAYLSYRCPGTPLSFAVTEQGRAAGCTAVRIVRDLTAAGTVRRALVIVAEQSVLPYPTTAATPDQHRAVALLFDSDAPGLRLAGLRQCPGVLPSDLDRRARTELAELLAETGIGRHRLVLGEALSEAWPGAPSHEPAPAGQPMTGVWWPLAEATDAADDRPIVLADYEPELGYLCLTGLVRD